MSEKRTEYWKQIYSLRSNNPNIKEAINYFDEHYEETDEVINDFIHGSKLSNEEYIAFIAIRRLEGLRRSSGNGSSAMMNQIRQEYKNTPWKFIEEFLQNADDCTYDGIPEIQITVNEENSSIEFAYNELGFTRKDIWSLTQFSESTKPGDNVLTITSHENGIFYNEKTGRKGIGFKSVFSLDAENVIVHICSNGYTFKLDNEISSIVPVWENYIPTDNRTHVRVELVNPRFSLQDIYPQFRSLVCVSNRERLFSDSPILFMHKLRTIMVRKQDESGLSSFVVSLRQNQRATVYGDTMQDQSGILSGIVYQGKLCHSELAPVSLCFQENDGPLSEVPCLRYSETLLVNGYWNLFSIIAPIIQDTNTWKGGSLFRTFAMVDHYYTIPFAMNLPYELNMARKGISYSDAVEENIRVSECMFSENNGVFWEFLTHLRECEGIAIDQYFPTSPAILFDDTNNRNRDDYYVPLVNLGDLLSEKSMFPLFEDENKYVSLNDLTCVDPSLLDWPESNQMLCLILGKSFIERLVARRYLSCKLLENKRSGIINQQFVTHINDYLQLLEDRYGLYDGTLARFLDDSFYPFLLRNMEEVRQCDGFNQINMYMFELSDGSIIRENCRKEVVWMDGTEQPSYHNYRTIVSSKTNLSVLLENGVSKKVRRVTEVFSQENIQKRAAKALQLSEIINVMEEIDYYGGNFTGITFPALKGFALAKEVCDEPNPLRDAGLLELISKQDAQRMAACFHCNLVDVVKVARPLGLRERDDFFVDEGRFWKLNDLTLNLLHIIADDAIPIFLRLLSNKLKNGKKIDVSYDELREAGTYLKLYFVKNSKFIVEEAYDGICLDLLNDLAVWENKCNESTELLLRAVSKAGNANIRHFEIVSIDIAYIVNNKLGTYVKRAIEKYGFAKYLRIENDGYFDEIPRQEILDTLMSTDLDEQHKIEEAAKTFYCGNLSTCHSEGNKTIYFIVDTLSNAVYLHGTDESDFRETFIFKYLQAHFDAEKNRLLNQVKKQTQSVFEKVIRPMVKKTNDDWDIAFERISQEFPKMSKEDVIHIISRFRLQSYSESLGNASQSHEREIIEDYREEPWKFAYEFLQNTDDCTFPLDVVPEIAIRIDREKKSVTFEYNEIGFSLDDINAITSYGNSTKSSDLAPLHTLPQSGVFDREKTGRKGRGFKSVFALPGNNIKVHIVSNGYSFRFEKRLGEIIPIWEEPDCQCAGTRITVEGFSTFDVDEMFNRLRDTLFVNEQEILFASSPLIFMKKLRRVRVSEGKRDYSFRIEEKSAYCKPEVYKTNSVIVSGIKENGTYRPFRLSNLEIHQSCTGEKPMNTRVIQVSYMKDIQGLTRVISIMAPIILEQEEVRYTYGSLYHTLPLGNHSLPVPVAINTAFAVNSGRNALVDENNELNTQLTKCIFEECLPETYRILRDVPQIDISAYIPKRSNKYNHLFNGMMHVTPVNVRKLIRRQELLKLYSGEGYISCERATILPKEYYTWPMPHVLAQTFENSKTDTLVLASFMDKIDDLHTTTIFNDSFVEHINEFMDQIEKNDKESIWTFLSEKLYPTISENYENLKHAYWGDEKKIKQMKVFAYRNADGTECREDGNAGIIWLKGCPARYKSYLGCRVFSSAPVQYDLKRDAWVSSLLNTIDFQKFDAGSKLAKDNWESAITWLKIGLYYGLRNVCELSYLNKCVFSDEIDPEENIFREAYSRTKDEEILSYIIKSQDIDSITEELQAADASIQETDVTWAMQQRGLRQADDFFDQSAEIVKLTKPTLAVLRSAGFNRITAMHYVQSIARVKKDKSGDTDLVVSFDELATCSPIIFTCLLRFLLTGGNRSQIAGNFLENTYINHVDNKDDYTEALICSMAYNQEESTAVHSLEISVSEIKKRKLGEMIQLAQFSKTCPACSLLITRDVPCALYESREIKKSLHWLYDDNDTNYEIKQLTYYTADLSDAFDNSDSPKYVCDEHSLIVHHQSPLEHILKYMKQKYTLEGKENLLVGLIRIAGEQFELQDGWNGTKKEYVMKLASFRDETDKFISFLCPGYQRGVNEAAGDIVGSLIAELLQNINDCRSKDSTNRSLVIELDTQEHTMTLTYDEIGFQYADVYSITAYGQSTKHDEREGEKGLGFKKVFTVFSQVDIYSNGFSFSLTDKKPTVPQWLDVSKDMLLPQDKTTMVFRFASPETTEERVRTIWENALGNVSGDSLFLGLRNLSNYELRINDHVQSITRDDIIKNYYVKELPILETYRQLHDSHESDLSGIQSALRSRIKCSVMTDLEFENYLSQLTITAYLPRKGEINGTYYSTLPTKQLSGCSMYVDVPFELSTGRDGIIKDSPFNKAMMNLIYNPNGGRCSVMSFLLSSLAKENSGCRLYEYFPDIDNYLNAVADEQEVKRETIRNELYHLPIIHTYNQDMLASVEQIFTADKTVYRYMRDVQNKGMQYDEWLRVYGYNIPSEGYLASYEDGMKDSLKKFATHVGGEKIYYPLNGTNGELTIQYFEFEYGTEGGA